MVPETRGGWGRTGEVWRGGWYLHQPPPISQTSPTCFRPPLVLRQRRERRCHLADRAGVQPPVRPFCPRLSGLRRERRARNGGRLVRGADAAYGALASRAEVDPRRIYVYGRSLGSAVRRTPPAPSRAGLILESPLTNAARWRGITTGYCPLPAPLSLDNLANVRLVHCPILLFHGDADRLVPTAMGKAVAAAAAGRSR